MRNFFSRLAGDSPQVLEECSEKERINSAILGMTLIIPIALWFAGGWATAWMMNAPLFVCLIAGGSCGSIVALLDRGMMTYLSRRGRSVIGLAGRMLLAVAASMVFAHPAIFILARGIIEREIESAQELSIQARQSAIIPQLENARARADIEFTSLSQQVSNAEAALNAKRGELRECRAHTTRWLKEADDEARGLRGSPRGERSNYNRALAIVAESKKREATIALELEAAEKGLERIRGEARDARSRAKDDPEIVRLGAELASVSSRIRSQRFADPLSRFEALHRLMARNWQRGDYSVGLAYVILCLVLLGLEVMPLLLKIGSLQGEHALKTEGLRFKVQQDLANLIAVYPALSLELTQLRLRADAQKESLRLDHGVAVDYLGSHRRLARSIMLEKAEVFEMAHEAINRTPKSAIAEHREFAERLAKQIVDGFIRAVEVALTKLRAPAGRENPV